MLKALLVALALGLLAAAPAEAVTINGPWWAQRAVEEAHSPVPDKQTVLLQDCPGWSGSVYACNFPTPDSPIYIPRAFYSRTVLFRELGGRFDTLAMTPAARWHFMAIMRYHGPWWSTDPTTLNGLIETFEDAYADCALGIRRRMPKPWDPEDRWIDDSGYDPYPRQHLRVCALIRRTGVRAGMRVPVSAEQPSPLASNRPAPAPRP